MFIQTNRRCYNRYHVPIDSMLHPEWPPTYVTCDCGERAKHIVHFKRLPCGAPHFIETRVWKCPACGQKYALPQWSFTFERLEELKK
ncbi:hypothetical protein A5883_003087 [Enterococcus sp. 5B3_DIV0040]|nr:hypothetical protein A5883_003087 [Enterococcus sp. 5B3_DIV0040]